jgi:hypothetical protein
MPPEGFQHQVGIMGAEELFAQQIRTFTILQLRRLYETIGGNPLDRDQFRWHMTDRVDVTGEMTVGTRRRAAELFRRRTVSIEHWL